jgi:hypothetical protein
MKLTQKFRCSEVSGPEKVSTNERPALSSFFDFTSDFIAAERFSKGNR